MNKQILGLALASACSIACFSTTYADLPKSFDYSKASTNYVDNTSGGNGGGGIFDNIGNVANPFYFGGMIGPSEGTDYCNDEGSDCEDTDTSWKLIGGYKLIDKVAAEIAYASLGDMHKDGNNSDSSAFSISAVGSLPVTEQFDAYAKIGATRWSTGDEDGFGLVYGIGAKMHLNESTNLRAEWEKYPGLDIKDNGDTDINVLSVGIELSTF